MKSILNLLSSMVILLLIICTPFELFAQKDNNRPESFKAMEWRFIGPIVGNRGSVVLGHPSEPNTFYHGASNGLWKTEDAGTYWVPVGDEYFNYGSIGAMEFSESNPDIAYRAACPAHIWLRGLCVRSRAVIYRRRGRTGHRATHGQAQR